MRGNSVWNAAEGELNTASTKMEINRDGMINTFNDKVMIFSSIKFQWILIHH